MNPRMIDPHGRASTHTLVLGHRPDGEMFVSTLPMPQSEAERDDLTLAFSEIIRVAEKKGFRLNIRGICLEPSDQPEDISARLLN